MLIYKLPKFQTGGLITPKDSTYIVNKINKDPLLSDKYRYAVENTKKEGDILWKIRPDGNKVKVDFNNMKAIDRAAIKHKIDQDLIKEGKQPIYNIFTSK